MSLLLWEGRSLTFVGAQAGHSVATLARRYAGVIEELEDQPRTSATEAIRHARSSERTQIGRIRLRSNPPTEVGSSITTGVGDTGLEPVTSALSRRRSPS